MSQSSTPEYPHSADFEPDLQPVQLAPQPVLPPADPAAKQGVPRIQYGTTPPPPDDAAEADSTQHDSTEHDATQPDATKPETIQP